MTNLTVGSFSLGEGPLTAGECLDWVLITLLSHRPQSLAAPRADPTRPAMKDRLMRNTAYLLCSLLGLSQFSTLHLIPEMIPRMSLRIGEAKLPKKM